MDYRVEIVPSAEHQFRKLNSSLQNRITPKLVSLKVNPRPFGSKKLRDTFYYRLRVGDYRIIYAVDDRERLVKILDIAHRREVYR
ncbi:MAG: type II toxin-antitoxin system mRNA interferase toxin, RelE/StbE family [Candidatus Omnitrophica bacterium CG08_land_8_20_14_0_20_41_16]|uniref:Type II toxin-antitoxin system mRNA interferase toxin, RelE/StbE family n=1 Tax=Candidatus Sherwoodlollariibacterium unditelluris TaxID=1974757 RepID=A0A2G9YKG6_9BACT|nr:MAG: type II toxin-antitoxin system mRNA interferase toxin, RelE/StbE family [Candidatus Omnitrophica bacterium CG23_combo_of_CG06-09_8_20_14_all_41_10]PIS34171.1 MAG: type II toxin-antitoxin system mRNA interferase toxin, RelE/StbE family [Candidatus Omnitrophica bacterium CG08_land_8_20_14_0_20_41_16]